MVEQRLQEDANKPARSAVDDSTLMRTRRIRVFGQRLTLLEPPDLFTADDSIWRVMSVYQPFLGVRSLPMSGVAIDIGAAHGAFSVPFALAHPNWTVWCFEPDPVAFSVLLANIAKQGLTNIVPLNLAVADVPNLRCNLSSVKEDLVSMADSLTAVAEPVGFRQHREKLGYVESDPGGLTTDLVPVSFPTCPATVLLGLQPNLLKITAPGCEEGILATLGRCESLRHVVGELWRRVPAASVQRSDGAHREVLLPLAGTPFRLVDSTDYAPRRSGLDVVVAMFNNASFIEDCIDGIIGNDCLDIRAIVVDDGSTDDSAAIVEAIYAGNSRVTVIRKQNGGCASARNFGRMYSNTTHIAFVDADDRMDRDLFASLLELAHYTGAEVVQGGFALWHAEDPERDLESSYEEAQFKNYQRHWLGQRSVFMVPSADLMIGQPTIWRRIYRRDFLEAKNIWFPEHIRAFDDQTFQLLTLHHAESIPCVDGPRYHYRQHQGQDIRAGDERFFYALETFRLILKRALAEGWNDFGPLLQSFVNTVNWCEERLRVDLRPLFIEGAAELWVWAHKSLGPRLSTSYSEMVFHPDFLLHVKQLEARLADLSPGFIWGYLDSGLMHVDVIRSRVSKQGGRQV